MDFTRITGLKNSQKTESFLYGSGMRLRMRGAGALSAVVCEYAGPAVVLPNASGEPGGNRAEVSARSFGAVTGPVNGTLTSERLASADPAVISPDKRIDAYGRLLPEPARFIRYAPC